MGVQRLTLRTHPGNAFSDKRIGCDERLDLLAPFGFLGIVGVAAVLTWIIPRPTPRASVTDVNPKKLFRPRLGVAISPDIAFRDETGRRVAMGDFGKDRPFILVPAYYQCPSLCNEVLNDLVKALSMIAAYSAGRDYDVVVVSFHPAEKPALASAKKAAYVEAYDRQGGEAGWHFLTGNASSIAALTEVAGFRYAFNPKTGLYAHDAGLIIATPDGRISKYLPGLDYPAKGLQAALKASSQGTIGRAANWIKLLCYDYDPSTGKYSLAIMRTVQTGGIVTVLALALSIVLMNRNTRRRSLTAASIA